jgi:hypothetical protein
MRYVYFIIMFSIFYSCKKYSQPSEPKLQGQWLVTRVDFYRIENKDIMDEIHYYPGDLFILPNENNPLDTIQVGSIKRTMGSKF